MQRFWFFHDSFEFYRFEIFCDIMSSVSVLSLKTGWPNPVNSWNPFLHSDKEKHCETKKKTVLTKKHRMLDPVPSTLITTPPYRKVLFKLYHLLTEFEVRTVSYGPSFPPLRFMAEARSARAINRKGKNEDP